MLRRGSAAKLHRARVAWLERHRDYLVGVPTLKDDITTDGDFRLTAIVEAMSKARLFGQRSSANERRECVRRLVGEFRHGPLPETHW